ncbi:MAG: serine protease, partial [Actinomycetota bacterium]|nr:serine protease [Actinomycetota bacterium]
MNVVDLVLLLALVYAAARGFRQGALSQVAAFGGAAAGLVLGAVVAPRIAAAFVREPGSTLSLLTLGLLLVSVVLGQAAGLAVGMRLRAAAAEV